MDTKKAFSQAPEQLIAELKSTITEIENSNPTRNQQLLLVIAKSNLAILEMFGGPDMEATETAPTPEPKPEPARTAEPTTRTTHHHPDAAVVIPLMTARVHSQDQKKFDEALSILRHSEVEHIELTFYPGVEEWAVTDHSGEGRPSYRRYPTPEQALWNLAYSSKYSS